MEDKRGSDNEEDDIRAWKKEIEREEETHVSKYRGNEEGIESAAAAAAVIICFCRLPRPGTTKTRLARGLSRCLAPALPGAKSSQLKTSAIEDTCGDCQYDEEEDCQELEQHKCIGEELAAAMYDVMAAHAIDAASMSQQSQLVMALVSDAEDEYSFRFWCRERCSHAPPRLVVGVQEQVASLGERMARAMQQAMTMNSGTTERVVIIGTDIPDLEASIIDEALELLHGTSDMDSRATDIVLGPARDGGFYLIGVRAQERSSSFWNGCIYTMLTSLFEGILWSTSTVLSDILQRAHDMCIKIDATSLPLLMDIDTVHDLKDWLYVGSELLENENDKDNHCCSTGMSCMRRKYMQMCKDYKIVL